jgi:cytochrome d ubiquinol oxidase subunit I
LTTRVVPEEASMDVLELARWQFGITTVYHFILVPLTIGLSILVAIMQTAWVRTGKTSWLRLTKFYGKLLMINFALGVATGIVQEFQFGMNWAEYSRYVGDVFGAPLAMEALAAFFLESTFLGLWIFGWDRLPKRVHLATVWLFAIGANISAYFILAANSWMQHPVGAIYNPETERAEMTDIGAILTNPTALTAFPHVIATAFLVAGTVVAGIAAAWLVVKHREIGGAKPTKAQAEDRSLYRTALRFGAVATLIAGVGVIVSGDYQAKMMFEQQPMKMAAAEALCETEAGAQFSLLTIGDLSNSCSGVTHVLAIPNLTSYLATGDWDSTVTGVNDLQAAAVEKYGEGDYTPNLAVTYWSFRLMIGLGAFSAALALAALWLTRKGRFPHQAWFKRLALIAIPMPYLAASIGWLFTEMGRQPWVVAPNPTGVDEIYMLTQFGVSSSVSAGEVLTSMIVFTLIYAVLGVFWARLMVRYAKLGALSVEPPSKKDPGDAPLSFAY